MSGSVPHMPTKPTFTAGLTFAVPTETRSQVDTEAEQREVSMGVICREALRQGRRRMRPYKANGYETKDMTYVSFMVTPETLDYLRTFANSHRGSLSWAARAHLIVGLTERSIA